MVAEGNVAENNQTRQGSCAFGARRHAPLASPRRATRADLPKLSPFFRNSPRSLVLVETPPRAFAHLEETLENFDLVVARTVRRPPLGKCQITVRAKGRTFLTLGAKRDPKMYYPDIGSRGTLSALPSNPHPSF